MDTPLRGTEARRSTTKENTKGNRRNKGKIDTREVSSWRPSPVEITSPDSALEEFETGYLTLLDEAKSLQDEIDLLQQLKAASGYEVSDRSLEKLSKSLIRLALGNLSSFVGVRPLGSLREAANEIAKIGGKDDVAALEIAIKTLEDLIRWLKDPREESKDKSRDAMVTRTAALKSLLPAKLYALADQARMHVEHEYDLRSYVNDETMYGDNIFDIPREDFLSTEDGYAWNMEELAQAIRSSDGIMRNPLSKLMFTPTDVAVIVQHPRGKSLAALQVDQSKLKRGVRSKTIEELKKLAGIFLGDETEDQLPSRSAVDQFAAYLATLPPDEQRAIDKLKVPAVDSHTGIAFDTTIGEAVSDARANRVCFHKTGDFLGQAAEYLKRSK